MTIIPTGVSMRTARGDLKVLIAQMLADYRHNRLEVTYGRKKCAVMAVDEMAADKIMELLAADATLAKTHHPEEVLK